MKKKIVLGVAVLLTSAAASAQSYWGTPSQYYSQQISNVGYAGAVVQHYTPPRQLVSGVQGAVGVVTNGYAAVQSSPSVYGGYYYGARAAYSGYSAVTNLPQGYTQYRNQLSQPITAPYYSTTWRR